MIHNDEDIQDNLSIEDRQVRSYLSERELRDIMQRVVWEACTDRAKAGFGMGQVRGMNRKSLICSAVGEELAEKEKYSDAIVMFACEIWSQILADLVNGKLIGKYDSEGKYAEVLENIREMYEMDMIYDAWLDGIMMSDLMA